MAHVAKYAKGAVGNMFAHYARSRSDVVRSNENIDPARTHLNYNLAPQHKGGQVAFLRRRLAEVKVQKRADVNLFCDWIVTIPKDFLDTHPDREREFFENTYNFLKEKYGEENVISAYVHRDEVTPHMHFAFIPVVQDKKRGGFKVSAKEALTRSDLRSFHDELTMHLLKNMGYVIPILNQATKDGNRSIKELKRSTASRERQKLMDEVNALQDERKALQGLVDDLRAGSDKIQNLPKGKKTKIGQNIVLTPEEYQQLTKAAAANSWESIQLKDTQRMIERLQDRNRELESRSKERELLKENQQLKRDNLDLAAKNASLLLEQMQIHQAIDLLPISDREKERTKTGNSYPVKRNLDFEL